MALSKERKGEIALLYLKNKLREDGIRLKPDTLRQIGNTAKTVGIPFEEAKEFVEELVREMVEETFARKPEQPETQS